MNRAVFFDLDGTLTDYARLARHVVLTLAQRVAARTAIGVERFVETYETTQREDEEAQRAGRLTVAELRDRGRRFGRTFERLGVSDRALTTELAHAYAEARRTTAFPMPGAKETLELLAQHDVWVAIVTEGSSKEQRGQLAELGWADLIDDVVVSEDVGAHKPDPALAATALAHAGVSALAAVSVGDRAIWDLKPAKGLGMTTVLFESALYRDEAEAGAAFVDARVGSHPALQLWLGEWLVR